MQIYVGNMAYSTTEEGLAGLFGEFGAVDTVKIITDRETGRAKGFGFITMNNEDEGQAAIAKLNDYEFEGRTLRVNEARPREPRSY